MTPEPVILELLIEDTGEALEICLVSDDPDIQARLHQILDTLTPDDGAPFELH